MPLKALNSVIISGEPCIPDSFGPFQDIKRKLSLSLEPILAHLEVQFASNSQRLLGAVDGGHADVFQESLADVLFALIFGRDSIDFTQFYRGGSQK